jgi:hypothetical protein
MGIDPEKVPYLATASKTLGPIREAAISQRGETIGSVGSDFALLEKIPAQRGLRLRR